MVDRVPKVTHDGYRVDEAKEALDDEGKKQDQDDEQGGKDSDNFDKLSNKTDWHILFDKSALWRRNIEVNVEDIDRVKILGINLKTDPSLLKIRVFLLDGSVINTAFLSISRSKGLRLKHKESATVDINQLTTETTLRLTLPTDETAVDEEITRITKTPTEKSFSKTFKGLISKKSWMQRLGMQDPVSKQINSEIIWIYITVVFMIIIVGLVVLLLL